MARAEAEEEVTVHLELSGAEAKALSAVTAKVAGDPDGLRGHIQSIQDALESVGFPWTRFTGEDGLLDQITGSLKFIDMDKTDA